MMEITTNKRGFYIADFIDKYGNQCSIQKSSLATEDCLWLGVDIDFHGKEILARMHLTQEMVEELLPILKMFVETGELV